MPIYYGRDAVQHYNVRQSQALEAMGWFEALQARAKQLGRQCEEQLGGAAADLARAYLPSLDAAALERSEKLTGYVGFKRRDPLKSLAHEQHVLEQTVARIRNDERYHNREMLAGPDGTLVAKHAEALEMIEPFRADCAKFEQLEGFMALYEAKYDTPDYAGSWWQGDYWKMWATGDRICQQLELNDFGDDVLPAYESVASQRDFWEKERVALEAQMGEIHRLVQQHDGAVTRLAQLPELYLQQCHEVLAKHLVEADVALLDEWLLRDGAGDRGIRMALRKLAGLRAKFEILRELHDQPIAAPLDALHQRVDKYARKAAKYNRPRHYDRNLDSSELDHGFDEARNKLYAKQVALGNLLDRITAYDDYERFHLDNDADLWWHAFTRGKRPPHEMARLRRYYDKNANASPRYDDQIHQTAVAEAIAVTVEAREDTGYLS